MISPPTAAMNTRLNLAVSVAENVVFGANILSRIRAQDPIMPEGLLPILVLIAVVIIYTIAKVVGYSRQSDQQWRDVDKSKLREWEDDD